MSNALTPEHMECLFKIALGVNHMISWSLKDTGDAEHMEEVVSLTFQYIRILQQQGVVEWMFEEVLEFSVTNLFPEVMGIMVFELHQQIIYSNYLPWVAIFISAELVEQRVEFFQQGCLFVCCNEGAGCLWNEVSLSRQTVSNLLCHWPCWKHAGTLLAFALKAWVKFLETLLS